MKHRIYDDEILYIGSHTEIEIMGTMLCANGIYNVIPYKIFRTDLIYGLALNTKECNWRLYAAKTPTELLNKYKADMGGGII